jgi:hypothetical protein
MKSHGAYWSPLGAKGASADVPNLRPRLKETKAFFSRRRGRIVSYHENPILICCLRISLCDDPFFLSLNAYLLLCRWPMLRILRIVNFYWSPVNDVRSCGENSTKVTFLLIRHVVWKRSIQIQDVTAFHNFIASASMLCTFRHWWISARAVRTLWRFTGNGFRTRKVRSQAYRFLYFHANWLNGDQ